MKSFYHQLRFSLAGSPAPWKKSMFAVTYSWQYTILKAQWQHRCFLKSLYYLESLSNMLTSFMASYSFCSSVIPSIGLGCSSSTRPVTGLMLVNTKDKYFRFVSNFVMAFMVSDNDVLRFRLSVLLSIAVLIFWIMSRVSAASHQSPSGQQPCRITITCVLDKPGNWLTEKNKLQLLSKYNVFYNV